MTVSKSRLWVVALLAGALVAASTGAGASTHVRKAHAAYAYGNFVDVDVRMANCSTGTLTDVGGVGFGDSPPVLRFPTRRGERFASITVTDQVPGQTIFATVGQTYGNSRKERGFCNAARLPIHGGAPIVVRLYRAMTGRGPSVVTSGTVAVSFSR